MSTSLSDLNVGDGVWMSYVCRDIGYGVEEDNGEFIYRGREQYGKYTFASCDSGELIYLFDDEVIELTRIERRPFKVTVAVYLRPKTVTWERFAFTERMAARETIDAAAIEWPEAKLIELDEVAASIP
jgi:hypothetical protein